MASTLTFTFLERYHKDDNEFLNHTVWVTGDKTWVPFVNAETKEQSKQWMHTHSPNKPKKFKQRFSARMDHNNIRCVLWNAIKLCRAIQNKICGMVTTGVMLLHDNAHLHTAASTQALLEHFNWELSNHPPYSPDLTPVITTCLPTWRSGWDHRTSTAMRSWWKVSKTWLSSQVADFDTGSQKLIPRYKCLNSSFQK
jgi:hypothetical protein